MHNWHCFDIIITSLDATKLVFRVSDQVRHKPDCAATEDIVEGLYYLCSKNKGADQLRSYCAADLRLCFCIRENQVFSWRSSNNNYEPRSSGFLTWLDFNQPTQLARLEIWDIFELEMLFHLGSQQQRH